MRRRCRVRPPAAAAIALPAGAARFRNLVAPHQTRDQAGHPAVQQFRVMLADDAGQLLRLARARLDRVRLHFHAHPSLECRVRHGRKRARAVMNKL